MKNLVQHFTYMSSFILFFDLFFKIGDFWIQKRVN